MYTECFYKFTACFREYLFFVLRWFNPVFVYITSLTETSHNRAHLEYAFGNDEWRSVTQSHFLLHTVERFYKVLLGTISQW